MGVIIISLIHSTNKNFINIALLGTVAFAIQRVLPNFQQIFVGWSGLNAQGDSLIEVVKVLKNIKSKPIISKEFIGNTNLAKNREWKKISLKNISYSYKKIKNHNHKVFSKIYLDVIKKEKLAFYGASGSGKSTLIKIISGLLKPKSGEILIDNKNIHTDLKNLQSLRNLIAYVPQQTQILNKSIYDNLYLGANNEIKQDVQFLKKVLNTCILEDFINSQPTGISTILGFRGKSISGGQKQRLAIARAILERKEILILDEATTSLDQNMEKEIIENINRDFSDLTIIYVTHNPNIMPDNYQN